MQRGGTIRTGNRTRLNRQQCTQSPGYDWTSKTRKGNLQRSRSNRQMWRAQMLRNGRGQVAQPTIYCMTPAIGASLEPQQSASLVPLCLAANIARLEASLVGSWSVAVQTFTGRRRNRPRLAWATRQARRTTDRNCDLQCLLDMGPAVRRGRV